MVFHCYLCHFLYWLLTLTFSSHFVSLFFWCCIHFEPKYRFKMWSDFQVATKQNKNQVFVCFIKFCSFYSKKNVVVSFWISFYGKTKSANERALVLSLEVDEKAADAFDDTRTHAENTFQMAIWHTHKKWKLLGIRFVRFFKDFHINDTWFSIVCHLSRWCLSFESFVNRMT